VINLKDPKDSVPSLLAIIGIVGLAASVVLLATSGTVNKKDLARKRNKAFNDLRDRSKKAKEDIEIAEAFLAKNRWSISPEQATPEALDFLTKLAVANKVTVVSFRPQKSTESAALLQQPFVLTVDGPYMKVAAMIEGIERSNGRLAVNQIQLAAAEGESDVVSASITLVGFFEKKLIKAEPKSVSSKEVPVRG
jgi:Tfp pilus assembly protein PilO